MNHCPDRHAFEQAIVLLASGDVGCVERARIEQHLARCGACKARYEQLRGLCCTLSKIATQIPEYPAPPGFHTRVSAVIKGRERHRPRFLPWLAPIGAVACLALGAVSWHIARDQGPSRNLALAPHSTDVRLDAAPEQEIPPTLWAYRCAASQSDEALETMLAHHAAHVLPPDRQPISAFGWTAIELADL